MKYLVLLLFISSTFVTFGQTNPIIVDTLKTAKTQLKEDTALQTLAKEKVDNTLNHQNNGDFPTLTIMLTILTAILASVTIVLVVVGYISYKNHEKELEIIKTTNNSLIKQIKEENIVLIETTKKENGELKIKIESDVNNIIDEFKKESKDEMDQVAKSVKFYNDLQDTSLPTLRNLIKEHISGELLLDNIDWLYYYEMDFDEALKEIEILESKENLKKYNELCFLCKIKKAKILNDQRNKKKNLDAANSLFKELLSEQPNERDLLDILEQLGSCFYQKGSIPLVEDSISLENSKEEDLNNFLEARKYFGLITPDAKEQLRYRKAQLFIAVCDMLFFKYSETRDAFIESCGLFEDKDKISFELSRLGKYSCFNELDDPSCKVILHEFFKNSIDYNESINYWNENFPELKYFIERLKAAYKKYHDDNNKE